MNDPHCPDAYDIAVIGGGINGCGIARDAAGRDLKVFLCEQGDLGGGTSSASSKLIHGGLRYLEHSQFKLVRESLREQKTLLKIAPRLITPLRFILPHHPGLRPAWLIRAGLLLYDLLGGRRGLGLGQRLGMGRSKWRDLARHHADAALKTEFVSGFEYADCRVDDSRLVIAVAKDARRLGAKIATRTRCDSVTRAPGLWHLALRYGDGASTVVKAKALVNATGPWVARFIAANADTLGAAPTKHRAQHKIRLVQGSHIVVKKWFPGAHAYLLQNHDHRIVFVIPFQRDLAIIGTTEVAYHGDPANARITPAEIDYLCAGVNRYFSVALAPENVIWSYSGVRPLYDDGADELGEVTRDYVLEFDEAADLPPMVTLYGGKLTTFRRLAEAVLAGLTPYFPDAKSPWTANSPLPGYEISTTDGGDGDDTAEALRASHPFLPDALRARFSAAYGSDAQDMLAGVTTMEAMGRHFGHGLYQVEAAYQVRNEWAVSAEDILWRRTKLGLEFTPGQVATLDRWLASQATPDGVREPRERRTAEQSGR